MSQKSRYKSTLISGVFFLVFSIAVALYSQTIHVGSLNFGAMNARSFPTICAGIMAFLAICLIYQGIHGMKISPPPTEEELAAEKAGRKRLIDVALAVLLVALDTLLLPVLGYLIVTPLFLFTLMMLVTPKSVRRPALFAIIAVVVSVVVYLIFRYAFAVQLPMGFLG